MSTIVTRSGKGSPLTHNEVDTNFTNLNTDKVEKTAADITGGTINNTTIGATTPSTGVFTTLTATGQTSLGGAAGAETVRVNTGTNTGKYTLFEANTANNVQLIGAPNSANLGLYSTGGGLIRFYTASALQEQQFVIGRTASAVNYVQVTGAATSSPPGITVQGSDANVRMNISSKGTESVDILTNNTGTRAAKFTYTASSVNWVQMTGAVTGSAPSYAVAGNDTNIDLNLTTKGTGAVNLNTGNGTQFKVGDTFAGGTATNFYKAQGTAGGGVVLVADGASTNVQAYLASKGASPISFTTAGVGVEQFRVAHTASAVNYVQVTGAATGGTPFFLMSGSDANIGMVNATKGTGAFGFWTNSGSNQQFGITHTASAVNRLQVTGGATGVAPVLSAQGSDTNIPLVLQPKGTGALQAQQTDSTATGGNARGANAVDWSTSRATASQVASGGSCVVGGGYANTATVGFSTVVGGFNNTVGYLSTVVGGQQNQSTGTGHGFAGAGYLNTANGFLNVVVGGASNSGTSASAVTTQSATMNGTTAVTLSGSNANIKVGQLITGTSIATYTYVAAISGTSLTLSQAASGSSTSTLSFYTPHGVVVGGGNNQATGSYSFIGGGGDAGTAANRNVASGDYAVVVGGRGNTASGVGAVVVGGGYDGAGGANTASGAVAFIGGGRANKASSFGSSVIGGFGNTSNGTGSSIYGGDYGTTRSINGIATTSASETPFGTYVTGQSQTSILVLGRQTTDATPIVLRSDPSAASTTNQVILPNNSAYYFKGSVIANVTGGGNTKAWAIEGAIKRGANAASTALVGTPTVTSGYADAGASTWAITATADTTNGGLAITFTGQAGTTIRVVAKLETTEVTF